MEERKMSRLIIATLITMLASPVFATDAPKTEPKKTEPTKTEPTKTPAAVVTYHGIKNMTAKDKAYYEKAATEKGMIQTGSGLLYKSLQEGNGATPGVLSTVKVNYRGTLSNGKEFNSSFKRKTPDVHKMNRVFRCWQEGLLKMKVGGKAKLVCPSELAFKGNGAGRVVPPGALVIYEIELLEVK
jgi:FKBP-type peptidyl-prolyl cis-trans isomerase